MANRNAFLSSLRYPFFAFQAVGKKLAARLTSQFDHSSIPQVIDDDDLQKLKNKVDRIRAALVSAEELELSDVFDRHWMCELRDLLHRAEDVLEEIEFQAVQATTLEEFNVQLAAATDTEKRKREEVSLLFYYSSRESISDKIDRIMETYAEIASDRVALRLDKVDGLRRMGISRVTSSSSLPTAKLHGREEELLRLRNLLLIGEDNRPRPYSLISLVGMPSIGKTAIVQHLCNDEVFKGLFKHRFWVSASQGFDSKEITITMLNQFGDISGKNDLNSLQCDLLPHLTSNRLLLVLDDVWIGNRKDELPLLKSHWEILRALLSHAGKGSKVILTTQNNEIAKIMGSDHTVYISGLSDEHCREICREEAHNVNLILEPTIGDAIKKCKGMPLAAKAVGSFLNLTPKEQRVDALQNLWCDDVRNEIISFLRVCYDRLPHHLKSCFVYCSLFPKEYIFQKDHLVSLWLGQNFVELEPYRDQHLEECGGQYFDELVNRCLFQLLPDNELGAKRYMMHDLLHESAQFIAFNEHLRVEGCQLPEIGQRVRHSSLVPPYSDNGNLVKFELLKEKYLRTFLFLGYVPACKPHCISMPDNLFWLIRSLRALDLSYTNMKELPTSFNHLIHLRYLSLRKTKIEMLPESICGLFKLQTLDLKHCYALKELPQGIKHLNQLGHLELPKQKLMNICIPFGIGKLVNLWKLPIFIIGNAPGTCRIEDLQDLKDLGGQLHIIGLNHVLDEEQAKRAFLKNKLKLRKLKLQWSSSGGESSNFNPNSVFMVLTELQPGYNLQELVVSGYSGQKFPNWLGDPHFTQLVKVNLKGCRFCEKLPSLGQLPVLKHLTVQQLERVQSIGTEFCGRGCGETKPFPALEMLELRKMVNLEEWTGVEDGDFPCLQNLTLSECKKLRIFPQFNSVKTMLVQCCEQLSHYPQMASLRCLNLEGFEKMENLPHLSNLATLEKLEVVDCKQLSGVMNIRYLISLQKLKVVNCPVLCISADDRLPSTLEDVHIGVDCLMLGPWKPLGFEEVDRCDEGYRKLVKRKYTTGFNNLVTNLCTDFKRLLAVDTSRPISSEEPTDSALS